MFPLRKALAVLIALTLLTACGDSSAGKIIRYDLPSSFTNLDPQFTTDETARLVISNCFDGLLRQNADGLLEPCVASEYTVSADGLTYTFILRQDIVWSDGSTQDSVIPVTAHDFVFAFERMFSHTTPSPFATTFLCLKNAQSVLSGATPITLLGVRAIDDFTLEFSLEKPEPLLPELLASTSATPCNKEFFLSTRARYGLDLKSLRFNGPFYLRNWETQKGYLSLRANNLYALKDQVVAGGVDLFLPDPKSPTDQRTRFFNGDTDACRVDYSALQAVELAGGTSVSFEDTVWMLALNLKDPQLANTDLRRAIGFSLDRKLLDGRTPVNLRAASTLIPSAVGGTAHPFRSFAGDGSPVTFSQELSKRAYRTALTELGIDSFSLKEILVCDEDPQPLLAGFVQQGLQSLSISTGLTRLPRDELLRRVNAGDYTMAILPLSAAYSSPDALLSYFRSDANTNFTSYHNPAFDRMLSTVVAGEADSYELYRQAEQLLLSDCPVIPLYFETTYYAMAKGVSDINFSPFLSSTSFKDARKK